MAESQCSGCPSASTCTSEQRAGCSSGQGQEPQSMLEPANKYASIKKVIGIVSGKGGVGKSFVTASLAAAMKKNGHPTGIMDADITGPSIPKMFGVQGEAYGNAEGMILPVETKEGIRLISISLLMENPQEPVIWRGPVIGGAVRQFWTDVVWGDLDYLFIDMPPGTGDVPLTVFQSLPVDGIMVVTSPQELVQMIVHKAFRMASMMHIPVLGVVENFSYLKCPDCGKEIRLFGESHVEEAARELGIPVLGKIPLDPEMAQAADQGAFYEKDCVYLDAAVEALKKL